MLAVSVGGIVSLRLWRGEIFCWGMGFGWVFVVLLGILP
jgi:hypothetical protein